MKQWTGHSGQSSESSNLHFDWFEFKVTRLNFVMSSGPRVAECPVHCFSALNEPHAARAPVRENAQAESFLFQIKN